MVEGVKLYATRTLWLKKRLLIDIKDKFIKYELNNNYIKENIILREYKKPKYHITVQEFYKYCENGTYIGLKKIK